MSRNDLAIFSQRSLHTYNVGTVDIGPSKSSSCIEKKFYKIKYLFGIWNGLLSKAQSPNKFLWSDHYCIYIAAI